MQHFAGTHLQVLGGRTVDGRSMVDGGTNGECTGKMGAEAGWGMIEGVEEGKGCGNEGGMKVEEKGWVMEEGQGWKR